MRFDWKAFLTRQRIPFVTSGPNTAAGNISVRCPWCGEADASEHMGISLHGRGWGCFRNQAHRGKSTVRLVAKLLGCSEVEAKRLVGPTEAPAPTVDDLEESYAALRLDLGGPAPPRARFLVLPPSFKPLLGGSAYAQPFVRYLQDRGYRSSQIAWLAKEYRLYFAVHGSYAYRLIIPIYDRYGELLTWTARTIRPDDQPRYKTLRVRPDPDDPSAPVAKVASNHTVLGLPVLWGATNPRVLIIVEGPFDALKITAFGHTLGVYATCLFGLNPYPEQRAELLALADRFDRVCLLQDEDAALDGLRLDQALLPLHCEPLTMPPGRDDPGAMTGAEVVNLAMNLIAA